MTATQIRAVRLTEDDGGDHSCFLQEIAAQLAEMNTHFETIAQAFGSGRLYIKEASDAID